jgi:uncharacterized membrane protein YvlD (DUF360 family)
MNYLKSLGISFLTIFFANYLLPGIDVVVQTKLPHVGGDLIFPVALAVLNALIVPILKLSDGYLTVMRLSVSSLILNFALYALLKLIPSMGIHIASVQGYMEAAALAAASTILLGYLEIRRLRRANLPL